MANDFEELITGIHHITDMDDSDLTDDIVAQLLQTMNMNFSPELSAQAVNQIVDNLEKQGLTKIEANRAMDALSTALREQIYGDTEYTGNKKILVDNIVDRLNNIFAQVVDKYHSFNIELPIKLLDGATAPAYAHPTDAGADVTAYETVVVPAHSTGNAIRTGMFIALPEGWVAYLLPRSSIGMKSPLRMSNSVGCIDSDYRGEVKVLYDNISDSDYLISAGDRIAQMVVMPCYHFRAKIADSLTETDRGEGGFGSTGK